MGGEIDQRSDLFNVGLILYELLAGKLPLVGSMLGQPEQISGSWLPPPPRRAQPYRGDPPRPRTTDLPPRLAEPQPAPDHGGGGHRASGRVPGGDHGRSYAESPIRRKTEEPMRVLIVTRDVQARLRV